MIEVEKVTKSSDNKECWITARCQCKEYIVIHIYGNTIEWNKKKDVLNLVVDKNV